MRGTRSIVLLGGILSILLAIAPAAIAGGAKALAVDLGRDVRALGARENLYWLAGGSLLTWFAYEIEDPAGARRALDDGVIDPIVDAGNIYADIRLQAPLALGLWGYGAGRGHERLAAFGYDLTRALALTSAVTGVLKPIADRERPNGEDFSYPSGHTAAAFSLAGVVSRHAGGWATTAAVTAGCLTALGRMEDLKHYASDTAAGATIGWIIGRSAARYGPGVDDGSAWKLTPMRDGLMVSRRF